MKKGGSESPAAYKPKNFAHLLGTEGFSNKLLRDHFTLYEGYVKNVNELTEDLGDLIKEGKGASPLHSELKRRFGWEFNGMRLHEYYFGNMKKGGSEIPEHSGFLKKIEKDFGSYEFWEKDFKALGTQRGIGWAVLSYDLAGNRLLNIWVNEHDTGHLAGCPPILILDVFEHAFMTDYGLKKADYIEAFFKALHWQEAQSRYDRAAFAKTHAK